MNLAYPHMIPVPNEKRSSVGMWPRQRAYFGLADVCNYYPRWIESIARPMLDATFNPRFKFSATSAALHDSESMQSTI